MILSSPFEPDYGLLLPTDTLALSEAEIDWAKQQSQMGTDYAAAWQIYLNALARIGLQHWLEHRAPDLLNEADLPRVSIDQLCEVTIGNYRLYLIATDAIDDAEVPLTHAAVTTNFRPHFYVLVEVFEELQQVRVGGYLSQAQLAQLLPRPSSSQAPTVSQSDLYWLSITDFDLNIDRLLLQLSCLNPETSLGTSSESSLELTSDSFTSSIAQSIASTAAINAARWINNQLDQAAQDLAWVLLPPSAGMAMRSLRFSSEQLGEVMADLMQRGEIAVPPQVGHAYRDIQLGEAQLRLYAVTWELPNVNASTGWILLLILGTPTGSRMPSEVRLQVRDQTQLLADVTPAVTPTGIPSTNRPDRYLYAQVSGELHESFYVTLSWRDRQVDLPPITFIPES